MADNIKKLPRDGGKIARHFEANGIRYTIRTADEGTTIERWSQYEKMSLVVGYDANFQAMYQNLTQAMELCNGVVTKENNFTDLVMHLNAMQEGVVSAANSRYNQAMYLCSLFIVRDDEDLTTWSEAEAEAKIADWNAEGYDVQDFLWLALSGLRGFESAYKSIIQRLTNQTAKTQPKQKRGYGVGGR